MSIFNDPDEMMRRQFEMQNRVERRALKQELEKTVNERVFCRRCNQPTTRNKKTGEIRFCRSCRRLSDKLAKHKLPIREYDTIMNDQDGKCSICRVILDSKACIDIEPENNHVRGILCRTCSKCLGLLKNDHNLLANASQYVKRNKFRRAWNSTE